MDPLEQIEKIAADLAAQNSPSPYVGSALSALHAAADNLKWEAEAQAKRAAAPPAPPAG